MSEIMVTASGLRRLEEEVERLRRRDASLAQRMHAARENGGVAAENGEYLVAVHERELLERRLRRLEGRLREAEVVEPARDGEIEVGERVTVLDLATAATAEYRIVGAGEGDPAAGEVSYESPVGRALLGRRVGDVVEAEAPGRRVRLEVVEVDG